MRSAFFGLKLAFHWRILVYKYHCFRHILKIAKKMCKIYSTGQIIQGFINYRRIYNILVHDTRQSLRTRNKTYTKTKKEQNPITCSLLLYIFTVFKLFFLSICTENYNDNCGCWLFSIKLSIDEIEKIKNMRKFHWLVIDDGLVSVNQRTVWHDNAVLECSVCINLWKWS